MARQAAPVRPIHFSDHVIAGHRYRVGRWRAQHGTARPLLFFSGVGASVELLAPFLERLSGRDVVTFDMPGIGGSHPHVLPYRLSAMADVARHIVTELDYAEADVAGMSWGGMLAQEYASRHRLTTGRLVLMATSLGMPMIPGSFPALWKLATSHRYSTPDSLRPYLSGASVCGEAQPSDPDANIPAPHASGYWHQVLAMVGWTGLTKLVRVKSKTLIIMGSEDKLVPPANGRLLRFIAPDARLEVIEGAGHLLALSHTDIIAEMVEAFLDSPE